MTAAGRKFDRLSTAYLEECGSASWTLRNLGSKLVAFLGANPKFTLPRTALAVDVARVEWACVIAFDEAANVTQFRRLRNRRNSVSNLMTCKKVLTRSHSS